MPYTPKQETLCEKYCPSKHMEIEQGCQHILERQCLDLCPDFNLCPYLIGWIKDSFFILYLRKSPFFV